MEVFDFARRQNRIVSRPHHNGSRAREHIVQSSDVHLFENPLQESVLDSDVLDILGLEILTQLIVEFYGNLLVVEKIDGRSTFKSFDDGINFLLFFNYSFHCSTPIV